jgi:hypothetical protein
MIIENDKTFANKNIILMYNGPLWSTGIYGMAEMFRQYLDLDGHPSNASTTIFAVFIEQLNNMMMHSEERVKISHPDGGHSESPKGSFVLGNENGDYFMQAGNAVSKENADILKERIDKLNALDKKELLQGYKDRARTENDNPESSGAGIGLYEIAWRAKSKIEYTITPYEDNFYFTMYVKV